MKEKLQEALNRSFIDAHQKADVQYTMQMITNKNNESSVWAYIADELTSCQKFYITAAFITPNLLIKLKAKLADLNEKGVSGKILISAYLKFNKPDVYRELLKIPNVEVRVAEEAEQLHAKCYYFDHGDYLTAIIGSSNLTVGAMFNNDEWNTRFSFLPESEMNQQLKSTFEASWATAVPLTPEWVENYKKEYVPVHQSNQAAQKVITNNQKISPNAMQREALEEIMALKEQGEKKALLISATGTGKTYLGAFATKAVKPKRFLFIVHRQEILAKACESFQKILGGPDSDYALYTGNNNDLTAAKAARYIFASEQMLGSDNKFENFERDEFELILIDEVHHAGDKTYQKLINYFKPNFMLGMTATPERNDDYNIFELFDYNVAYEIRLHQAVDENMLVPFQYVGVTDYEYENEAEIIAQIKAAKGKEKNTLEEKYFLEHLATKERAKYIIEQSNYYGFSGDKLHGLIFCRRTYEAKDLASYLTDMGHPAIALTGNDSTEQRQQAIADFEAGKYEYILTVDIFNEGIDIPMINQVIMLRSTQSSIVFIQQLGRGLRKYPGKEFLVVIDFIGNYDVNYMAPFILTNDHSGSKDKGREILKTVEQVGRASGITFREIPRERIYKTLDGSKVKLNDLRKVLKPAFTQLQNRMGNNKLPMLVDFYNSDTIKPLAFVGSSKGNTDNYYQFVTKAMKIKLPQISAFQFDVLTFVMKELMNGKRQHELLLLKALISGPITQEQYLNMLNENNCYINKQTLDSVMRVLDWSFFKKDTDNDPIVTFKNNEYRLNKDLTGNETFTNFFSDEIEAGLLEARDNYDPAQVLTVNQKYSRKDFCRLMGWKTNQESTIYGYKAKKGLYQLPIFVTYNKSEDINDDIKYEDYFKSQNIFHWSMRKDTTLKGKEAQNVLDSTYTKYLFVKKSDAEKSQFVYLGSVDPIQGTAEDTVKDGINYVQLDFSLRTAVTPNQYRYFESLD